MDPSPLGAGRTADVFRDGPGRVRRVYRDGRDAAAEAALMRHVAAHGYPVPAVYDVEGPAIVMAEVVGPTLADDALAHPARLPAAATLLRDLHDRLAAVPAPPELSAFAAGDGLLHLDLHPFNVLLDADGPVVIDWCTAARGPSVVDRAYTWVVMTTAVKPSVAIPDDAFEHARRVFTDALLDGDDDPARSWIPAAARRRLTDPEVLPSERPRLLQLGNVAVR